MCDLAPLEEKRSASTLRRLGRAVGFRVWGVLSLEGGGGLGFNYWGVVEVEGWGSGFEGFGFKVRG